MGVHVCQLRPESRGEIRLKSRELRADSDIRAGYLDAATDLEVLVRGVRLAREIFAQQPLAGVVGQEHEDSRGCESDDEIAAFVRASAETIDHSVGTCRMGHDDAAVVDARLRVKG